MSRFFVYLGRTPERERTKEREREKFSSSLLPLSAQRKNKPTRANNFQFLISLRDTRRGGGGYYYEAKQKSPTKKKSESENGRKVLREDLSIKEQQRREREKGEKT